LHEAIVDLIRQEPEQFLALATPTLDPKLFANTSVKVGESKFPSIDVSEFQADLVLLAERANRVRLSIITEVQLGRDPDKIFTAAQYVIGQFVRTRRPVMFIILTPYDDIARWASRIATISGIGPPNLLKIVGPSEIPPIRVATAPAAGSPLWCVLSALAHARSQDGPSIAEHAVGVLRAKLDERTASYYTWLILEQFGEQQRNEIKLRVHLKLRRENMPIPAGWTPPDPDLLVLWNACEEAERRGLELGEKRGLELGEKRGLELGENRGKKLTLLEVMTAKGWSVTEQLRQRVLEEGDSALVNRWVLRLASAMSLDDIFGND
jgi:hypothetical protein